MRKRRWVKWAIGVVALGAIAVGLVAGPPFALGRARRNASECLAVLDQDGGPGATACVDRERAFFLWAMVHPSTRREARAIRRELSAFADALELRDAVQRQPNARARHDAAALYLEHGGDAATLNGFGAHEEAARV